MKVLRLLVPFIMLPLLTACWPFTTGQETPTLAISNVTAVRDEVTDLPLVQIDWDSHYPSDVYAQSTDISIVCHMQQQYTSGQRKFVGVAEPIVGYQKNHSGRQSGQAGAQKPATIEVPESGRHIKGPFKVTCDLVGAKDPTTSNTITVDIPPACKGGAGQQPIICPLPTPTGAPPSASSSPSEGPSATPSESASSSEAASPSQSPPESESASPSQSPSPSVSLYPYDKAFGAPQWMVHATGHGTTSGPVQDNFYTLINGAPNPDGSYQIADGSGGTFSYSSDYNSGPHGSAREVCTAAQGVGLPSSQTWTLGYNYNDSFDCTGVY